MCVCVCECVSVVLHAPLSEAAHVVSHTHTLTEKELLPVSCSSLTAHWKDRERDGERWRGMERGGEGWREGRREG